jgi:uncharacterized protein (DUF1800 family)
MTLSREIIAARRFGYAGAGRPGQAGTALLAGLDGDDAMAARFPVATTGAALAAAQEFNRILRDAMKAKSAQDNPDLRRARLAMRGMEWTVLRAALARIAETPAPLRERLCWFWADHFSVRWKSGAMRALPGAFVDEAIRPHLAGRFGDLLKAAVTHPAMVLYLDQFNSIGPDSPVGRKTSRGLNENLAREVLELHTLGAGSGYTQADVVQFAELLTGLAFSPKEGTVFRPGMAEPGAEVLLGARYGGRRPRLQDILDALDDLALRPQTADHLARKLAVHFVADDPPADLVGTLSATYRTSGGDLRKVYAALLEHPAARSADFAKVRQPFDFIAACLRTLGVGGAALMALPDKTLARIAVRPLIEMGQPFQQPEGPNGWPEGSVYWLTPQGLAWRITWAMRMPSLLLGRLPDARGFVRHALGEAERTLAAAAMGAETRADAVGLVLASPAFNRR